MRSRAFRPVTRYLGAGVLALLASILCVPPASAEEDGGGWFGAIVDLLKPTEGSQVDVPLRKTDRTPKPEPSAEASEAPTEVSEAPQTDAPASSKDADVPSEPPVAEAPDEEADTPPAAPLAQTPPSDADTDTSSDAPVAQASSSDADTDTSSDAPVAQASSSDADTDTSSDAPVAQASSSDEDADTTPPEVPVAQAPPPPPVEMPARVEGADLSHVHRAVRDLTAEIHILREELGARDAPPAAERVEGRAPVHIHVKTLEVWTKVAQAQRRLGVPAVEVGRVPPRAVDAADILVNVEHLRNELARIKVRMGIARAADPAPIETAVTAPIVYRGLAEASLLLDALRGGPLGPEDLYRHATTVLDETVLIAAALGASVASDPSPAQGSKQPVDIAQQLLRAGYKVVNLQTRLQMDASSVPATQLDRVSPSQNYDALTVLRAELVRIKRHLSIDEPPEPRPESPAGRRWGDVFALAQLIVRNIDRLSAAAAN